MSINHLVLETAFIPINGQQIIKAVQWLQLINGSPAAVITLKTVKQTALQSNIPHHTPD